MQPNEDPLNIDAVLLSMYQQQIRTADKLNADAVVKFQNDYAQAKLNWTMKGMRFPYDPPRLAASVEAKLTMPDPSVTIKFGPDLVVDPVPPAPWDAPPDPLPPPGSVWFHDIGAGPDLYAGSGVGVKVGDVRVNPDNGIKYRQIQFGRPGTINYFLGWKAV